MGILSQFLFGGLSGANVQANTVALLIVSIFHRILLVITRFYWVSPVFSPGSAKFHGVLSSLTGFNRKLPSFTGFS